MSSSRFLSHHCVHLTELAAHSPTPLNNTGQCGSAIISEIARTASGRAIVIAVPQRRPNYFGPPSFSPDHSLTYWLCSAPQAGAGPDMLVHEAGTWCMTVIQGHMLLASKQIWQCLTQSNIPSRPSVRCKDRRKMVQHLHGNIAHYLFCPDIHGGSIFVKFFVIVRNRTGRQECKLNKSWALL